MPSVIRIPNGALGFDTDTMLTPASAGSLRAAATLRTASDYTFAIRYLSLSSPQNDGDLSSHELGAILSAGLGCMAVQHVQYPPWWPSGALGITHGTAAVTNAKAVGLLPSTTISLDWEGLNLNVNISKAIAYINNWTTIVWDAGYSAMLYVGYDYLFDAHQLFYDLDLTLYWRSMSDVPTPDVRGYCVRQSPTVTVAGVSLDPDVVWTDNLGGAPSMMIS